MEYRFLGNTGIKVSAIGLGNFLNGDAPDKKEKIIQIVKKAYSLGINFFDTAESYGFGEGELQYGEAFKELGIPREELVVSSKIFWAVTPFTSQIQKVNQIGLSRKHIIEGVKASLKRLQLDYLDIVYCHRFDEDTPLEETIKAFNDLIQQGLIHYWGTSEWSCGQIFEAREICAKLNLIPPVCEQPQYNMMVRERFEVEYGRLFDKYRMGSTVWGPLCAGILTGKYNDGKFPLGSRLNEYKDSILLKRIFDTYFAEDKKENLLKLLNALSEQANKIGCTQTQLAMAWVLANRDVSTAITSASKPEQLDEIVKSLEVVKKITPEINKELDQILGNKPQVGIDYKTYMPNKSVRRDQIIIKNQYSN
ncbi:aldo/keto reductase family oxidoreductase (macronuclear) [Tetrahymena thermophila SB210]|uniref:Aldo/keto reductase family oxidoreductase n=1 Tax=Tetrahymena thermophila (strain SB210) TaxID=312017 RepID=Q23TY3_TETTS|nr:aldo/keto reductase family oxidoreductase [Tetrahymena thermophila SB210]EAR99998.1 aldo/keto reductase family oxidoreductase [Tetrahymena thermophila SB210]|eukprot:XP_001020243.1 aldo/keto reductase family oxidoreductase [Tetrahymena thermophila SB210]